MRRALLCFSAILTIQAAIWEISRSEEIPSWLKAAVGRPLPEGIDRKSIVLLHEEKLTEVSGATTTTLFREAFRVTGADGRNALLLAPQGVHRVQARRPPYPQPCSWEAPREPHARASSR